jgi:predicted HAD superfamily Cof-like phosphohydrolase
MRSFHYDPTLLSLFNKVGNFHKAFKVDENKQFGTIDAQTAALRYKLLQEENLEYLNACALMDKVQIADALTDMLYVLIGTMRAHGFDKLVYNCFAEVHRSNMSKLDSNGEVILREDGKIMKSENYTKPSLQSIIFQYDDEFGPK